MIDSSDQPASVPIPLSPPSTYVVPVELCGPAPRPIPPSVRAGPAAQKGRAIIGLTYVSGVVCIVLSFLPFVQTLGQFILPLQILLWIGIAVVLLGGFFQMAGKLLRRGWDYVERGLSGPGRVVGMFRAPTLIMNGQPTSFALTAIVEVNDPDTGQVVPVRCTTDASGNPRFKVGDYVTVVWLRHAPHSTIQIYDFLNLTEEHCLEQPRSTMGWFGASLVMAAIALIPTTILACVYSAGRYEPIQSDFQSHGLPLLLGTIILGVPTLLAWIISDVRESRTMRTKNEAAAQTGEVLTLGNVTFWLQPGSGNWLIKLIVAIGIPLLIGGMTMCMAWALNAWFDRSPEMWQPANVTRWVRTTHSYIIRDYKLEYTVMGLEGEQKIMTTPAHLEKFKHSEAEVDVRRGAFGWAWVNELRPLEPLFDPPN